LQFAPRSERILVTHNRRHFVHLHLNWPSGHSGIVVCPVDQDWLAMAQRIHAAMAVQGEMKNELIPESAAAIR
jgi:hypothetical protein